MKYGPRSLLFHLRRVVCRVLALCACGLPMQWAPAQQAPTNAPASSAANMVPAGMHGVVQLDGPWRFQMGDDPSWADPAFDDSAWPTVTLGKSLAEQGFESYAGFAWYRLHIQPQQLQVGTAGNAPLHLLIASHSVGQLAVYVNGVEVGHSRGMTDSPRMYLSPPFDVVLPQSGSAPIEVAVRSWAAPGLPISHGLLERVEAGAPDDIADRLALAISRHWDQHVIAEMVMAFLFLGVAALGMILYLAQRHHSEYLWLALLCFSAFLMAAVELANQLAVIPAGIFDVLTLWTGRIFMAVTVEFVLRFAGTSRRQFARGFQIGVLLLPFLSLLNLQTIYQVLARRPFSKVRQELGDTLDRAAARSDETK